MISNLHYISQGESPEEHLKNIRKMCAAGANWIQLRLKNECLEKIQETAQKAKDICDEFQAKLIINDFPEIAKKVDAHGVHLGKEDHCPIKARKLLGPDKIIGGTANSLEDCEKLSTLQVDYIGLGPFRFTTTKKELSPILGVEGYGSLLNSLNAQGKMIPVIAIGGITLEDLPVLAKSGVQGVAISGWLTSYSNPEIIFKEIQQHFSEK